MPFRGQRRPAYIPVPSISFPPLVRRPTASKRHFCVHVRQGRGEAKTQDRRKGHLKAHRALLMSGSVPIFQRSKTPHRGPQSAPQRIKQPRPAPLGVSRGVFIAHPLILLFRLSMPQSLRGSRPLCVLASAVPQVRRPHIPICGYMLFAPSLCNTPKS